MKTFCIGATLLLSLALLAQVPVHTDHFSHIKTGTVLYGAMGSVPPGLRPAVNQWLSTKFDLVIGGGGNQGDPHGTNPTKVYWAAYIDFAHIYNSFNNEMYRLQESADANGFDMESMLVHTSVDQQYTNGTQFQNINQFDHFEPAWQGSIRVAGVFTENAGTYVDVTSSNPVTIASTLYVGYQVPFDQANFVITTPRSGGSVAYQYWNGSAWTTLSTGFSDGTSGLTTTGQVYFHPPSNWARRTLTVNVSTPKPIVTTNSKYWLRVVVTGASTAPAYSTVLGDNWAIASGANNSRGWDATAAGRINIGTPLEYNPTPPAGATAKFKYQSRVTFLGINVVYGNPSYNPGGINAWGKFMEEECTRQITVEDPFDACFFDDQGQQPPQPISPANAIQYYDFNQVSGWIPEVTISALASSGYLKTVHGANFNVGGNGFLPGSPPGAPIAGTAPYHALQEAFWAAPTTYQPNPGYTVSSVVNYDWFAPGATNPNSVRGYYQCFDTWALGGPWFNNPPFGFTYWHYQDNGNRTPMECLAMHYLGANANTAMMYNGGPSNYNFYSTVDQVYTYGPATTTTNSVSVETTGTVPKSVGITSSTGCTTGTLLKIGAKNTGGDIISGAFGRVNQNGNIYTSQMRAGGSNVNMTSYPNVIMLGDSGGTFTSLNFTIWGPSVQTPGFEAINPEYWNGSAWVPLTITDTTNLLTQDGTISWTAPGNWATTTDGTFTGYLVRFTTYTALKPDTWFSPTWKTFVSDNPVFNAYAPGVPAYCVNIQHLAAIQIQLMQMF